MGGVCAKNDAGRVATDAPQRGIISKDKQLLGSQKPETSTQETKFVEATINFNLDKGVEKKADEVAADTAKAWLVDNRDWEYTGIWKNERSRVTETVEVSHFQVRKKASATADSTPTDNKDVAAVVVEVDDKILEKKPAVEDKKQSFVDQVAEGLAAKIPADRFTNDEEANGLPVVEEEGKDKPAEVPTEDEDTKVDAKEDAKEESEDAENAACEYIKGDDEAPRVTIPEEVKAVTEQEAELIEAADVAAGSPSKLGAMAAAVGAKLVKEIEAEAEAENEVEAEEEKKESSPEKPVEADEPETAAAEEEDPKLGAMAAAVGAKLAEKVEAEAETDPEVVIPDAEKK